MIIWFCNLIAFRAGFCSKKVLCSYLIHDMLVKYPPIGGKRPQRWMYCQNASVWSLSWPRNMIWHRSLTSRPLERLVVLKLVITQYLIHVRLVKWPQTKDKIQTRFQNIPNHHYGACIDPGTWTGIICSSLELSKEPKSTKGFQAS